MDRGDWWATGYRVTKSWTWLSDWQIFHHFNSSHVSYPACYFFFILFIKTLIYEISIKLICHLLCNLFLYTSLFIYTYFFLRCYACVYLVNNVRFISGYFLSWKLTLNILNNNFPSKHFIQWFIIFLLILDVFFILN